MNCQIQQEKKRGMKKTHNIYYLQHKNLKTLAPKLITATVLPLKTQKKYSMTQTQNSVPLKRYYNSSETKIFLNLKMF